MAQTTFSGPVKSQRGFVTAGPDAAIVIYVLYVDSVISFVRAPVVEFLMIFLKPFSDRTGPLNVVFAIIISS